MSRMQKTRRGGQVAIMSTSQNPPPTHKGEYNWFTDYISEKNTIEWVGESWTGPTKTEIKKRVKLWHLANVDLLPKYALQNSGRIEHELDAVGIQNIDTNIIEDGEEFEFVEILSSDQFLEQIKDRVNAETNKAQKEMKKEWG